MTTTITRPAKTLSDEIAEAVNRFAVSEQELFWFAGDSSASTFVLKSGWKPQLVHSNGLLMREGSSEDYTVTYDGFIYSVEFAVAPAAVDIGIIARRVVT